jgi:NitT/TauT family transport system substrate-binding protein
MKRWSSTLGLALACVLLIGASAGHGQAPLRLKQTGFRVLYIAPVFLGIERGFFREEGIDLEYVEIQSGVLGPASLVGGQAHFSDIDPLQTAELREQGYSLLMMYNLVNRVTLDFILRNEVAERLRATRQMPIMDRFRALRGLNIGITRPGAPTDVFPRYFLRRAGLNPDRDANMVQVGGVPALAAAFRTGRIDGFMLSPPLPQTLEKEGLGRIIIKNTAGDVPELSSLTYVAHVVTKAFARHNPRLVRAYIRATHRANVWMRQNPDEALRILQQKYFTETPMDVLRLSWEALLPAISPDGRFSEAGIKAYLNVFETIGQTFKIDTSEGDLWTNEFLR